LIAGEKMWVSWSGSTTSRRVGNRVNGVAHDRVDGGLVARGEDYLQGVDQLAAIRLLVTRG
jgi:hypothetical protein